jgi:hypothetical protein
MSRPPPLSGHQSLWTLTGDSEDRRAVSIRPVRGRSACATLNYSRRRGRRPASSGDGHPVAGQQYDQRLRGTENSERAVDQGSCMALHRACPVQRSHAANLDALHRSVSARPCPGAPPSCPTHVLSRTPQTRPINDRPPTQTCWSAACAYAKRRGKRPYLVAGAGFEPATFGL